MSQHYDVAIIGAGILGLAHALAAAKKGKSVAIFERDARANGASIRNFGFVTVSGQAQGDCWEKAVRSREIWQSVTEKAKIPVLHKGLVMTARRPESEAVMDAFLATDMGQDCERLSLARAAQIVPSLHTKNVTAAMYSPHELRVESVTALPKIADWLVETYGVDCYWQTTVLSAEAPHLSTTQGDFQAECIIGCPGDSNTGLFREVLAPYEISLSKLQMMRIQPEQPTKLGAAVMSDLGLARYHGYADLPAAEALKARLDQEQAAQREKGVHLIVVQSADGSLVVGDSHEAANTASPFISAAINQLIRDELDAVLALGKYTITESWIGTYAVSPNRWRLTAAPNPATRVCIVTAGCGASTAFAIAEETIQDLLG